ncbi:hypothetical protein KC19_3G218800 [Ceratodon purpureus]|uniref:Protein kinase domain-containing protein n=1 Tax=Ceratodon purpureus TaxID=3225 RepID=A0A8T0IP20_CERPU|nr:hypothetical protein KC19_3G218800 [Ceratodon purpureus]
MAEFTSEFQTTTEGLGAPGSSIDYFSARIESLMLRRSDFASDLDYQIESSKDSWSEVRDVRCEAPGITDRELFANLRQHPEWGRIFKNPDRVILGRKIAEGGQAEIYEGLQRTSMEEAPTKEVVVKVFKKGYSLAALKSQWPLGMVRKSSGNGSGWYCEPYTCWLMGVTLLHDGRVAFILEAYWGDLRRLIDSLMLQRHKENRRDQAPFEEKKAVRIMKQIAEGMHNLHNNDILHRDLKAANVLVWTSKRDADPRETDSMLCAIADFECSVGVVGTGFWRAPEILLAIKNSSIGLHVFTKEADVYSYAMTCYEVLTGRKPFEDHPVSQYDVVLSGQRPSLPASTYSQLRELIAKCWHCDPSTRPTFAEIKRELDKIIKSLQTK